MVLGKERAGRTKAADLFHVLGRGRTAATEELFGLVPAKIVPFIVLADGAVLPTDLLVLFCDLNRGRFA